MIRGIVCLALVLWGSAALACPGFDTKAKHLYVSARDLASPQVAPVRAGGPVILDGCETLPGTGQVTFDPSVSVYYIPDRGDADLVFRTQGEGCDTVLLVHTPSRRWAFDDDNGGARNARLRIRNPGEGRYEIWVGTSGSFSCETRLTLQTLR